MYACIDARARPFGGIVALLVSICPRTWLRGYRTKLQLNNWTSLFWNEWRIVALSHAYTFLLHIRNDYMMLTDRILTGA